MNSIASMPYRLGGCLASLMALVLLVGCAPSGPTNRPDTVDVTGTVTYNDVPVSGATVTFKPQDPDGRGATGRTDDSGVYQMTTFEPNDGVIPGEYNVTVTKTVGAETPQGDVEVDLDNTGDDLSEPPPETDGPQVMLPEKYADASTSGLTATVTADGENKFDFQLTD